jgi:hypothetical protein
MKQTAVEWLEEQMDNLLMDGYAFNSVQANELYNQAKEIEKQQIIDSITQYEIKYNKVFSEQGILNVVNKAEQYYSENFKQD